MGRGDLAGGARVAPNTIVITGYRRPALFRDLLHSLVRNDLAGWRVAIHLEPSPQVPAFAQAAAELLAGQDYAITVNPRRLGIRANPFHALDLAFAAGAPGVLYLEEDLVVAPDATALANWYFARHRPEWLALGLLAGGCGATGYLSHAGHPGLLFAARTFNSLGFALRAQEWRGSVRGRWMRRAPARMRTYSTSSPVGWDWQLYALLVNSSRRRVLQPVLARAKHMGRDQGEFCTPAFHDRAFPYLPLASVASQDSEVRAIDELPPEVRGHAQLWDEMAALSRQPGVERLHLLWRYGRERLRRRLGLHRDDRHRR